MFMAPEAAMLGVFAPADFQAHPGAEITHAKVLQQVVGAKAAAPHLAAMDLWAAPRLMSDVCLSLRLFT